LELLVEEREGFITAAILEQGDTLVVNTSPHLRQKVAKIPNRGLLEIWA